MSTKEKTLYNRVTVPSEKSDNVPLTSRTYRGLSTVNEDATSTALYDLALIKQDLLNHFHIRQGEKLENPQFGTIIWDLIFEPLTPALKTAIAENVTEIINFDPRVVAQDIQISQYESGIQIECQLVYLPYNISENLKLTFDEANGLIN
jgi:phage baseplate assembly protein W